MEARLKLAVDHAPIAVFSIDRDGIITLSEGAGLAALGVRSGELVGKSVFDLYRDHPTIPGYIRRGLAGESFYYTVAGGRGRLRLLARARCGARTGRSSGVLGVSHDMSELRRLQARPSRTTGSVAMGTLAASVAHEINNPLTYVHGQPGEHAPRARPADRHLASLGDAAGAAACGRCRLRPARAAGPGPERRRAHRHHHP